MNAILPDRLNVYAFDLRNDIPARWEKSLSADERRRISAYSQPGDQQRFAAGRGLLRQALSDATGLAPDALCLKPNTSGKVCWVNVPENIECDLDFNISHSGDQVRVVIGPQSGVGIDIDQVRDCLDVHAMGRHVFTATERAYVAQGAEPDQTVSFFRLWVCKEAVAKALGYGLLMDLRRFEVDLSAVEGDEGFRPARWIDPRDRRQEPQVYFSLIHSPANYRAAVAFVETRRDADAA
jgi:4'-phosphopantetheinyl transferase